MDWTPLREGVRAACARATGIDLKDVLLETERDAFNASRGKRLRLDWEQRDLTDPEVFYQEQLDGSIVEGVITDREIVVSARFFCDDHRTATLGGGWAHELADRLANRLWLSEVAALYQSAGLVLASTDTILPDPRVTLDDREMSVATLRIAFLYRSCELVTNPPGNPAARVDYFDRVEVNARRPRAVYQRDLLALGPWRYLWLGEETDVARGRIVLASGDSEPRVGDPRAWSLGTGALTAEDPDIGQLLEGPGAADGQAIALALRAPAPATTISILGRIVGGIGWALEGLPNGSVRLAALGTGGETLAVLPLRLDGTWRVFVLHSVAGALGLYEGGDSAFATISGSHLAGAGALVAGALREPTAGVEVRLLGEVVTNDPEALRSALVAELGF